MGGGLFLDGEGFANGHPYMADNGVIKTSWLANHARYRFSPTLAYFFGAAFVISGILTASRI